MDSLGSREEKWPSPPTTLLPEESLKAGEGRTCLVVSGWNCELLLPGHRFDPWSGEVKILPATQRPEEGEINYAAIYWKKSRWGFISSEDKFWKLYVVNFWANLNEAEGRECRRGGGGGGEARDA